MSATNLDAIMKRYKFSDISIATWRDPALSVHPARGGPTPTFVTPDAAAKPYTPAYKVKYNLPPKATDDVESGTDGDGDDAKSEPPVDPTPAESAEDTQHKDEKVAMAETEPVDAPKEEAAPEEPVADDAAAPQTTETATKPSDEETPPADESNDKPEPGSKTEEAPAEEMAPEGDALPADATAAPNDEQGVADSEVEPAPAEASTAAEAQIEPEPLLEPTVAEDASPFEEQVDDRRVSFAPGTPEPKPTVRKKKTPKGTKSKKKRLAIPLDSIPPDVMAMLDADLDSLPRLAPPPPEAPVDGNEVPESAPADAEAEAETKIAPTEGEVVPEEGSNEDVAPEEAPLDEPSASGPPEGEPNDEKASSPEEAPENPPAALATEDDLVTSEPAPVDKATDSQTGDGAEASPAEEAPVAEIAPIDTPVLNSASEAPAIPPAATTEEPPKEDSSKAGREGSEGKKKKKKKSTLSSKIGFFDSLAGLGIDLLPPPPPDAVAGPIVEPFSEEMPTAAPEPREDVKAGTNGDSPAESEAASKPTLPIEVADDVEDITDVPAESTAEGEPKAVDETSSNVETPEEVSPDDGHHEESGHSAPEDASSPADSGVEVKVGSDRGEIAAGEEAETATEKVVLEEADSVKEDTQEIEEPNPSASAAETSAVVEDADDTKQEASDGVEEGHDDQGTEDMIVESAKADVEETISEQAGGDVSVENNQPEDQAADSSEVIETGDADPVEAVPGAEVAENSVEPVEAPPDEAPEVDAPPDTSAPLPEPAQPTQEESKEIEAVPDAPPSPDLSKTSSRGSHRRKADHWERKHTESPTVKFKNVLEESKVLTKSRSSKHSRDEAHAKDSSRRFRRLSSTATEEEERRRRRAARKADEEARRAVEEMRKREEEDERRRIRHEARRAARKAAAEETAKIAREEAEAAARREAERSHRRRRRRSDDGDRERPRSSREVKATSPTLTMPKALGFAAGESVHGTRTIRSHGGAYRPASERPPSPEVSRPKEISAPKEASRDLPKEEETAGPPSSNGSKSHHRHRHHHHRSESDRPTRSSKDGERPSRRPVVEERPRSFFGALLKGF